MPSLIICIRVIYPVCKMHNQMDRRHPSNTSITDIKFPFLLFAFGCPISLHSVL